MGGSSQPSQTWYDRYIARTGGGNRDYYESSSIHRHNFPEEYEDDFSGPSGPWNEDLRSIQGFLYDTDDDFDSTYADFYFSVPEQYHDMVKEYLTEHGNPVTPAERWQMLLSKLSTQS